ncbi:LOB domain-containing protein 41-like isoform X2 [Cicer arietinum]|uniref:LOB domain-containing protein 41-like isoform X2 n=1 Tax=Cicer arietinum TaxID=3827 RepID=A0A3Q7WZU0_CICAR|nr:LOB domain-containing protein 41-like isoform X2 [Cicer arietinum]
MRMSCNGCRVLRKGCSEDCIIRPCLEWIKCPQSQANATVFLAKFYGRAGLINLINSGPQNLRPGSWQLCQAAVDSVLKGEPIKPITSEAAANERAPPLMAYDIRHVAKDDNLKETQQAKTRSRFKRTMKPKASKKTGSGLVEEKNESESLLSYHCKDNESGVSVETSILFHNEPESKPKMSDRADENVTDEVGLELRLGIEPVSREEHVVPIKKRKIELKDWGVSCKVELGLELVA